MKEKKMRVEDALHAPRAAVEEGVVAGGGSALLYATRALDGLTPANSDQKVGIEIVRKAIQTPARQIAENAGSDGSVIVGKLLESKDTNWGYNAQAGKFEDLVKAGIIDPTKVVRTALQNSASVAGLMLTTETLIAEKPKKKEPPLGMPPGGGMGGMDF
jgi:chaperonin GroEL